MISTRLLADSGLRRTEFVGTSISSDFPAAFISPVTAALADNPHTKFFDGAFRGYVRCAINRKEWRSDSVFPSAACTRH